MTPVAPPNAYSEGAWFAAISGYLTISLRPPQLEKSTFPLSDFTIETPFNIFSEVLPSTPLGLNQYAPRSKLAILLKTSCEDCKRPTVDVCPLPSSSALSRIASP